VFGPDDSNTVIQGAEGDVATLGSGREIPGWVPTDGNLWAAPAPGTRDGTWDFRTLTVNGQWRRRSYLPGTGTFEHLSVYNEPWRSTTGGGFGKVPDELRKTMVYKPEDLGPWLSSANAEIIIYHSWDMSHARIERNDVENHTLYLTPLLGYPAGAFGVKRYTIQNVAEGMHEPGLWYLDRDNERVVYWPLPDEDMSRAKFVAPVGTGLISIQGSKERPVRSVTLRGLSLADTNVPWKSPGFGAGGIGEAAVKLAWAEDCTLEGLHLRNLGARGVSIYAGRRNRVAGSLIEHVGTSGITAGGDKEMGVGDDLILADNHVHHCGLVYPAACAIQVGNVANAVIARNLVHDVGYTGITYSGSFTTPRAINGVIENNHVYRCMTELVDGGAIYVTGQIDGTVVRANKVHDIVKGFGIYPDEQTRNIVVSGNLSYRCLHNFHIHMAHDILFENNVCAYAGKTQVMVARNCKDISFERNVYLCEKEPVYSEGAQIGGGQVGRAGANLYYTRAAERPAQGKSTWEQWAAAGYDKTSVFADPRFSDPGSDDFRLRPESPAYALGFKDLDLSRVPEE